MPQDPTTATAAHEPVPPVAGPVASRHRPGRKLLAGAGALLVLVLLAAFLVGRSQDGDDGPATGVVAADYPFGPRSLWRQDITQAPVSPDSEEMVAGLRQQVEDHWGGVASWNVDQFTASWYTVGPDVPVVDLRWEDCQGKGYTPDGVTGPDGFLTGVPIPEGARPSPGGDGQLTVYQPSTDRLWEFWQAEEVDGAWQACWGGRIDSASTNPGVFPEGFGASASGLAMSAGAVWVDDARRGRIDHALGLAILEPAAWPRMSWPANRTDGGNRDEHAVPEGTRLRLDPSLDLSTLDLTPLARMVASAAQRYGFIVTDTAGAVNVGAQLGQPLDDDPQFWQRQMAGVPPYRVLENFPWDRLQALPHDYGKPSDES